MSKEIVQSVRANFPTPLGVSHPKFLNDLIIALGPAWGLLRKSGGVRINVGGVDVSQDVVTDRAGIQWDCLGDGEGAAIPVWDAVDPAKYVPDPARFYRPDGAVGLPDQPPDGIIPTLIEQVDDLEETLAQFVIATLNTLQQADSAIAQLADRITKLEGRLDKPVEVAGHTDSTGPRFLAHSHPFKTEVKL